MPYTQIHWVKLEKRLLNDVRFYTMTEESQLIYIKLLMLAADTKNKIPKSPTVLKAALRSSQEEEVISKCMEEIMRAFPKFKETKDFYKFNGWGVRHNWIANKEKKGSPLGTPENKITMEEKNRISEYYVSCKRWNRNNLCNSDWIRIAKGARDLHLRTGRNIDKTLRAIAWVSEKGYMDWTLETVLKKYPEFEKNGKTPEFNELERRLERLKDV